MYRIPGVCGTSYNTRFRRDSSHGLITLVIDFITFCVGLTTSSLWNHSGAASVRSAQLIRSSAFRWQWLHTYSYMTYDKTPIASHKTFQLFRNYSFHTRLVARRKFRSQKPLTKLPGFGKPREDKQCGWQPTFLINLPHGCRHLSRRNRSVQPSPPPPPFPPPPTSSSHHHHQHHKR